MNCMEAFLFAMLIVFAATFPSLIEEVKKFREARRELKKKGWLK